MKIGLGKLKARGARVVSINPVRTGYSAIADQWLGITPGTDGLLVLSLVHLLMTAGKIDLDYLLRYTNAAWLVDQGPRSPGFGSFLRDRDGRELVWDRDRHKRRPRRTPRREARALRHLQHRPDPRQAGVPADGRGLPRPRPRARGHRPRLRPRRRHHPPPRRRARRVAFTQAITLARPWTDFRGERHATMIGRPVAMHAMRGISAHSNGFQTCRAMHLLQLLLGSVETPGGFRFKPPYPKPVAAHPKPHHKVTPGKPLDGPHLGYPRGPEDLAIDADGRPKRIDKAFSWEAPLAAHGMMHMVIANAVAGDPYPIEVLFLYMANMAWNSSMNTAATMEMLTATDASGEYLIPNIIVADAYSSEMVAFADLVLPDTTYLERHDCISLLDRPISEPDAAADAIRWPVVAPDRDVRPFQSVLLDLGARLGLPGMAEPDGSPDLCRLRRLHRPPPAPPRHRPARRLARRRRRRRAAAPQPGPDRPLHRRRRLLAGARPGRGRLLQAVERRLPGLGGRHGLLRQRRSPTSSSSTPSRSRRFQAAALGKGDRQPPDAPARPPRPRHGAAAGLVPAARRRRPRPEAFPLHAITQRPAAMYHSWGSQNAWLRQIHGENPLYVPGPVWEALGFEPATGPTSSRRTAASPCRSPAWTRRTRTRSGPGTPSASAPAPGRSPRDAPEATRGFLLNHLIPERLPAARPALSNSDPVTGQAAWYDLRVRLERVPARTRAAPAFPPQASPVGRGPAVIASAGSGTGIAPGASAIPAHAAEPVRGTGHPTPAFNPQARTPGHDARRPARRPLERKDIVMLKSYSQAPPSPRCCQGALAQAQTDVADPAAPATAPGERATGVDAPAPAPVELSGDWVVDEVWHPVDMAAVAADQIIGADVRNADGQVIARCTTSILGADGKAERITATFGGFLGFGTESVVLTIDEVEIMQNDAGRSPCAPS